MIETMKSLGEKVNWHEQIHCVKPTQENLKAKANQREKTWEAQGVNISAKERYFASGGRARNMVILKHIRTTDTEISSEDTFSIHIEKFLRSIQSEQSSVRFFIFGHRARMKAGFEVWRIKGLNSDPTRERLGAYAEPSGKRQRGQYYLGEADRRKA